MLVAQDRHVLAALPKSAHPGAKKALAEIYNAEDKDHAIAAAKTFEAEFGAKWPKAVAKITYDLDVLLAFYDLPAEHWIHLRTTNPIESPFATVRLRQRVTKGPAPWQAASRRRSSSSSPPNAAGARSTHPPGRPGPCRRAVRERQARRTTQQIRR
ncbi:MAG: transposase [Micromonosporaceae bacterium]